MKEEINKIIKLAINAPSGENCQPWRFEVDDNKVFIYNIPEADQSLYNFEQKGSYVAHGALIENFVISATKFGYKSIVNIFPLISDSNVVAEITMNKTETGTDPLLNYIEKRCTNRREYNGKKMSAEQKESLKVASEEAGFELKILDDDNDVGRISKELAINERIIFENKALHDFFYNHILWKDEDQYKSGGFYIKTLEFMPHQLKGVRLFKNWFVLKILNKILKVSKIIEKENAIKYSKSGTICAIVSNNEDKSDFVNSGRAVERVWLTATKMGLSVHPCTGVLYLFQNIKNNNSDEFSEIHKNALRDSYSNIVSAFKIEGKTIPMLFRIGFADAPTAKAQKMIPVVLFK